MAAVTSIVSVGLNRRAFSGSKTRPGKCWCCAKPEAGTSNRLLGRKDLGRVVVNWLAQGMAEMAREIIQAEIKGDLESIRSRVGVGSSEFLKSVQAALDKNPVPDEYQEQCERARSHFPTIYDHFQRELREALVAASNEGSLESWQETKSWKVFKEQTKTTKKQGSTKPAGKKEGSSPKAAVKKKVFGLSGATVDEIETKVEAFVDRYLELLKVERDAELAATQQTLETSEESYKNDTVVHDEECSSLCNMIAISSSTGLGGTEVVSFRSREGNARLPPTSLSPGDMVCVRVSNKTGVSECLQGSVSQLSKDGETIDIVVRGGWALLKVSGRPIRIDKVLDLANATTYERNCEALIRLKKNALKGFNPAAKVVAVLFGEGEEVEKLAFGDNSSASQAQTLSSDDISGENFDESQLKGIQLGVDKQRPVVIIQGPPGTGKTSVVTELITKAVASGDRVLATAPTNAAVDNLVERLSSTGVGVVRFGNPARISPAVVSKSIDLLVNSELESSRRDFSKQRAAINRTLRRDSLDPDVIKELEMKLKELGKSLRRQENEAPAKILQAAQVVLCTNIGAGDPLMSKAGRFDLTVVDEAGQAIEPSCWIAMLRSSRTVLAGDVNQLSPTVFSREALEGGLGTSLMERASAQHGGGLTTMLQVQYRMNSAIASWTSAEMYGGLVRSASTVGTQLLSDSPEVESNWRTTASMLLLDTRQAYGSLAAGCEECMDYLGTGSFYNDGEADIVIEHVLALIKAGVSASSIVVQSPYLAQVHLLRTRLDDALSSASSVAAESIDSFQGREADAVVISMVRSNDLGVVGFLADRRRINVAVTRARKHVAIVCDSSTVGSNPFLRRLLQHIRVHGEVRSVQPPHLMMEFS